MTTELKQVSPEEQAKLVVAKSGNVKDTQLWDYGANREVFDHNDIKLYGVDPIKDEVCYEADCNEPALFKCNRKIYLREEEYFVGCGKFSCMKHTHKLNDKRFS